MTRTQITLEEDEYLFLKSEAASRGTSLSSVVRDLVRQQMDTTPDRPLHIWELAGLLSDVEPIESDGEPVDYDALLADIIAAEFDRPEDTSA